MKAPIPMPPASTGFYPRPVLSDKRWDRVIHALMERGTKVDRDVAETLAKQIAKRRVEHWAREQAAARAAS